MSRRSKLLSRDQVLPRRPASPFVYLGLSDGAAISTQSLSLNASAEQIKRATAVSRARVPRHPEEPRKAGPLLRSTSPVAWVSQFNVFRLDDLLRSLGLPTADTTTQLHTKVQSLNCLGSFALFCYPYRFHEVAGITFSLVLHDDIKREFIMSHR